MLALRLRRIVSKRAVATLLAVALRTLPVLVYVGHGHAEGQSPEFRFPIACAIDQTCWIVNYMDMDPGPMAHDFACGAMTYHGHNGTDIAIRDLSAMTEGVNVIAAASGRVVATRDEMADQNVRLVDRAAIRNRECGNGVVVDHGSDWTTQYCHLKRGSISVRPGDRVETGSILGQVGLSGETEYPHLHFVVRRANAVTDPFSGQSSGGACGVARDTMAGLWARDAAPTLTYRHGTIYNYGASGTVPTAERIRAGLQSKEQARSNETLYVWLEAFFVQRDDIVDVSITEASGHQLVDIQHRIDRSQTWVMRYLGKRPPVGGWPRGTLTLTLRLLRTESGAVRTIHQADAKFIME